MGSSRAAAALWVDDLCERMDRDPTFWSAVMEELRQRRRLPPASGCDRGTQVRPDLFDVELQTHVPTVHRATQTRDACEGPPPPWAQPSVRGSTPDVLQVGTVRARTVGPTGPGEVAVPDRDSSQARPGGSGGLTPPPPGCWNCRSMDHKMGQCPQPRRRFCFRCGTGGVSVRDCTRCNAAE